MEKELVKIKEKLEEILSPEKGYFGHRYILEQRPGEYEFIGCRLTEDIFPTLQAMSLEKQKSLIIIINYFEIHTNPLKRLLDTRAEEQLDLLYSEISWSHFMTVVMFGMLEVIIRTQPNVDLDEKGFLRNKGKEIKKFLNQYISQGVQQDVVSRYRVEAIFKHNKPKSFDEVVDHLWNKIRCGFVHSASLESKGLAWFTLSGIGTKEEPIIFESDVPMQEWLQMTWQAILNSYGYKGMVYFPKYIDEEKKVVQ